jgi:ribonucleoside-diphosphate reductase alpha chain
MEETTIRLIRRNGTIVPWNEEKVLYAISKAFDELMIEREDGCEFIIARDVTDKIHSNGNPVIHVEEVQDIVQSELMRHGYYKVAEAYILYRAKRNQERSNRKEDIPLPTVYPVLVKQTLNLIAAGNGPIYEWSGEDLRARIEYAILDLELCYSAIEIEGILIASLYNGISESDLQRTVMLNARTLIEKDADFSRFVGRLFMTYVYEEVLGWDILKDGVSQLKKFHQKAFITYLERAVEIGRLDSALLDKYNIKKLALALDPHADMEFDYQGMQTLYDRYLITDKVSKTHIRLETPQFFWMRVAMGIHLNHGASVDKVIKLYKLYKDRRFCSSTPTLFNSGTPRPQMSSCYLYWVDDSIEGIMQTGIADNAYLSKWAGGLGGSWTSVRGTGAHIDGTNGESQGVIPFLKMHNDLLIAVNQGGKRKGAGCAYLETWHSDIEDFLDLRKNTGDDRRRTHDMNTANWIPDLFMKRVEARQDWTLFRSSDVSDLHHIYGSKFEKKYEQYEKDAKAGKIYGKTIPAIDLWKKMLMALFETGHPWITFKDPCNIRSPQDHTGVIHSSNLCTEITLNTSKDETAVCNLGSIVLENHLTPSGNLDRRMLRQTISVAVEALDNVIDTNFYPTTTAETSNQRHRPIGLGVMGLQNALYKKGISFESKEAVQFNKSMMETIAYYAIEASSELAENRGVYATYKGSKWDRGIMPQDSVALLEAERGKKLGFEEDNYTEELLDWAPLRKRVEEHGVRNSNLMAIAPTATISLIMNTTPSIEPVYKNLFAKSNLSGDFTVLNPYLVRDLKAIGKWNERTLDDLKYFNGDLTELTYIPNELKVRYKTAFDVDPESVLKAAAMRQVWVDQAQSINLWLKEPSAPAMSKMYRRAWDLGLKTTYYLRAQQASDIEKSTVSRRFEEPKACSIENPDCEACQ